VEVKWRDVRYRSEAERGAIGGMEVKWRAVRYGSKVESYAVWKWSDMRCGSEVEWCALWLADHPRSISIEELRAMTWKDLVALWKEYVQALATTLVDKSEGEAKQHARLTELTDEISMLFVCLNVANPKAVSNFRCLDMEKGGNVEGRQSHASMLEMVNACDFTPDQRRIICDARRCELPHLPSGHSSSHARSFWSPVL
jgi:hypothetical protein